ncbi:MAG: four helix bundle protein [Candidatus Magasanikbacteria bacterium]|nr:four helix bundle protein [Candidatus Magasanikbacteria bacterium]
MYKEFHELEIWKEGYNLLMKIYKLSATFPEFEKYSLKSQITRSANSIIANIAEAHGRYFYKDKVRVFYIARGEIMETRSHLSVAFGNKYTSEEEFKNLDQEYKKLTKKLNSFINKIRN